LVYSQHIGQADVLIHMWSPLAIYTSVGFPSEVYGKYLYDYDLTNYWRETHVHCIQTCCCLYLTVSYLYGSMTNIRHMICPHNIRWGLHYHRVDIIVKANAQDV